MVKPETYTEVWYHSLKQLSLKYLLCKRSRLSHSQPWSPLLPRCILWLSRVVMVDEVDTAQYAGTAN